MCDPLSVAVIGSTILTVGSDVLEANAQNKQAKAQKQAALQALKVQDHELSIEEVEARLAGAQQKGQATQEVQAAAGDVRASAAARGVGGATIDLLLNDVQAQGERYKESVDLNTSAQTGSLERQKDQALAETRLRLAGAQGANPLATGLKIGGDLLDGASLFIGRRNKAKGP